MLMTPWYYSNHRLIFDSGQAVHPQIQIFTYEQFTCKQQKGAFFVFKLNWQRNLPQIVHVLLLGAEKQLGRATRIPYIAY